MNPVHLEMLTEALPVSVFASLPFVILLLSVALIPVFFKGWWEATANKLKVVLPLVAFVIIYLCYSFGLSGLKKIEHSIVEYIQFLILLSTLYIISGGIALNITYRPSPKINSIILLLGGLLASLIGTMGASALLIRPLLRLNSSRNKISHTVIFFILIVSNIGGALTPMGDPPLFMGFLKGVPFLWTLKLWKAWAIGVSMMVTFYYFVDIYYFRKENIPKKSGSINVKGLMNIGLLILVIVVACLAPQLTKGNKSNIIFSNGSPYREILFLLIIFASWKLTDRKIYELNKFTLGPIKEIAILFIGIFLTMIPAYEWLLVNGVSLGVDSPVKYFWSTGLLSGFLDNTPTYLMFFCVGKCQGIPPDLVGAVVSQVGIQEVFLKAISLGAVFMGGLTYIGNGPNLMVKDISEDFGVNMPSFFKFTFISFSILLPLFMLISVLLSYNLL